MESPITCDPSPHKILDTCLEQLVDIKQLTIPKIQNILKTAPDSIGTTSPAREFELIDFIEDIQHYNRLIDKAEKQVYEPMAKLNSVITTVTGIANRLGPIILAEIRNIHTFDNPAHLQSFTGLELSIYQSGQIEVTGKMVKNSSLHLRWTLL